MTIVASDDFLQNVLNLFDPLAGTDSGTLTKCSLFCFDRVTSTMDIAKNVANDLIEKLNYKSQTISLPFATSGFTHTLILAREQTDGRGREQKHWISNKDQGIYLSYLIGGDFTLTQTMGLSLAIGIAMLRAVELFHIYPTLKWPNDLLIRVPILENSYKFPYYRKLGGTLIETFSVDQQNSKYLCIGVGLNIFKQLQNLPIISIEEVIETFPNYFEILKCLTIEIVKAVDIFWKNGLVSFQNQWNKASMLKDLPIKIKQQQNEIIGVCQGIAEDGSLVIKAGDNFMKIYAGEVEPI